MSIFHALARFIPNGNVTLNVRTDARTAQTVRPLIEKLIADDRDGETYRCAIAHWHHAKRPPLKRYLGDVSLCQIDGPLQDAPADYPHSMFLPIGGLIETPGATVHLSPFEADEIQRRIQQAIEREIVDWTKRHGLYDIQPVDPDYDRWEADHAAKAMIAAWAGQRQGGTAPDDGIGRPDDCCPGETDGALCEACRKGPDHV